MKTMWDKYLTWRKRLPDCFPPLPEDIPSGLELGVLEEHSHWLWVREWDGTAVQERPVYLDERLEHQIERYFALAECRPELFAPSDLIPICMDRYKMLTFMEKTGRAAGLVFDNGRFYQVVADLVDGIKPYTYARVLYPDARGNGTVMIPRLLRQDGEPLFGVLHVFRHTIRRMSGGEFPRGFQEPDITPEENAAKELWEEFFIPAAQISKLTLLGRTQTDTGLSSGEVLIYLADLSGQPPQANTGEEGITGSEWITQSELFSRLLKGGIIDGMTQTAAALYMLSQGLIQKEGNIMDDKNMLDLEAPSRQADTAWFTVPGRSVPFGPAGQPTEKADSPG